MSDKTFTVSVDLTFAVDNQDLARGIVGQWTAGMPRLVGSRIAGVVEGSERTWDDDCRDVERLDRDDNRPITEAELFNGYNVDARVRNGRVPHALRRDLRMGSEP